MYLMLAGQIKADSILCANEVVIGLRKVYRKGFDAEGEVCACGVDDGFAGFCSECTRQESWYRG